MKITSVKKNYYFFLQHEMPVKQKIEKIRIGNLRKSTLHQINFVAITPSIRVSMEK